jgi:hypothetical protein
LKAWIDKILNTECLHRSPIKYSYIIM